MAAPTVAYEVRVRPAGSKTAWRTTRFSAESTVITIPGLHRGTAYEGEARSLGPSGEASLWVPVTFSVGMPSYVPKPPLSMVVLPAPNGVNVQWEVHPGNRPDTVYIIERSPTGEDTWTPVGQTPGNSLYVPVDDDGLYDYRVSAKDWQEAESAWSDIVTQVREAIASASDLAQETQDRIAADLAESLARAEAIEAEAQARAEGLLLEAQAREADIAEEATIRQTVDESLAQSISTLSAGIGEQFDSKKVWYFDADLESWTGIGGTATVVDGFIRAPDGTNTGVASPAYTGIDNAAYRNVKARIKRVGSPVWEGKLYWATTGDGSWVDARSMTIPEPEFEADGDGYADFRDIAWAANTNKIRLDLTSEQTAENYFLIDWVAIGRPAPGASTAALQEEAVARVSGDAAEAAARTTLATQLRGSYTGNNVNEVASGLIYEERVARSDADGVLNTAILGLDSRLDDAEGDIVANANAVSLLETRVSANEDELEAQAVLVNKLETNVNSIGGDNLLINSSFDEVSSTAGRPYAWLGASSGAGITSLATSMQPQTELPLSKYFMRVTGVAAAVTDYIEVTQYITEAPYQSTYKVIAGRQYTLSVQVRGTTGATLSLFVLWYNAAGTLISAGVNLVFSGELHVSNWKRFTGVTSAAPAGAVGARIYPGRLSGIVGAVQLDVDNVQFQEGVTATQYQPSTYQGLEGAATALQALTTRVTAAEGEIDASAAAITTLDVALSGEAGLYNGGFEQPLVGTWGVITGAGDGTLPANAAIDSGNPRTGSNCLRFNGDPTNRAIYNKAVVKCAPGDKFRVRAYTRTAGTLGPNGAEIRVGLRFGNVSNVNVGNLYVPWKTIAGSTWGYDTGVMEGEITAPANAVSASCLVYVGGLTSGSLCIDDIEVERVSLATAANASATTALEARVTTAEGNITATASAVTSLEAEVDGNTASLTQLSQVTASNVQANIITDPSFERTDQWGVNVNGSGALTNGMQFGPGSGIVHTGNSNLQKFANASAATAWNKQVTEVVAGQVIRAGIFSRVISAVPAGSYIRLYVQAIDRNNASLGSFLIGTRSVTSTDADWVQSEFRYTVPANWWKVRAAIQVFNTAGTIYLDDVYMEPENNSAAKFSASHTLKLDVAGRISGTRSENTGDSSSFDVLADIFRVIDPDGGQGLTWEGGRLWNRGPTRSVILGQPFGTTNDLLLWAGPNPASVGAAAKSNAIFYIDNGGNAYFGGSLSAGIIKNAAQSTVVSATAQVETGNASYNGGTRQVTSSLSWSVGGYHPSNMGAATLSAQIVMERSVAGGPWVQVGITTVTGARTVAPNEPGLGYLTQGNISGSVSYTDNTGGTGPINYRTRIQNASNWPFTVGTTNSGTQSTTILATEG